MAVEDMQPQIVQAYKDATDNLMYLKKEQVQITYYSWLVLAALYVLSRSPETPDTAKSVLATGAILVGTLSIYFLWSFQKSMNGFRYRLRNLYAKHFTAEDRRDFQS